MTMFQMVYAVLAIKIFHPAMCQSTFG